MQIPVDSFGEECYHDNQNKHSCQRDFARCHWVSANFSADIGTGTNIGGKIGAHPMAAREIPLTAVFILIIMIAFFTEAVNGNLHLLEPVPKLIRFTCFTLFQMVYLYKCHG